MRWPRRQPLPERIAMPQSTLLPSAGYLVGGAVRDLLAGRTARDFDWLVPDPGAEALRTATVLGATAFELDPVRGHWRVVKGATTLDYTPLTGSLEADLRARDFTVNALAADREGRLVDPVGGRADLRARRLRMTSETALAADPLRPLRGVRLSATRGLTFDDATRRAVARIARAQHQGQRPLPAWERVRDELELILADPSAARGLVLADELGLLAVVLPELTACRGVDQGGLHHFDVLRHSLEALHRLVTGFPDAGLEVRWATLLHDIGKAETREVGDDGRVRFHGHAERGRELAEAALTRLRLPQATVRRVGALVRYHMQPLPGSERAARRFVHRRRTLLPDLLQLMIADREAARGPLASEPLRQTYRIAVSRVLAILAETPPPAPLLSGDEVMTLLGIDAGPRVGEALQLVQEAHAVGDIATAEDAAALLERYAAAQGWPVRRAGARPGADAGPHPDVD